MASIYSIRMTPIHLVTGLFGSPVKMTGALTKNNHTIFRV